MVEVGSKSLRGCSRLNGGQFHVYLVEKLSALGVVGRVLGLVRLEALHGS